MDKASCWRFTRLKVGLSWFTGTQDVKETLTDFEHGLLCGLLIGEGSFTGDGKRAAVTVQMHVRHERLLRWLGDRFARSRLYGPYSGQGRTWFQWMMRGAALREDLLPLLEPIREFDDHTGARLDAMLCRYGLR